MSLSRFSVLLAYDCKGGIGLNGGIPWKYSEDLKFFRLITTGKTVVMGRKTYDSLPSNYKPLPNRRNIVITKQSADSAPQGVEFASSITNALKLCANDQTYIIGGAVIFSSVVERYLYLCDAIYGTEVTKDYSCDTFIDLAFKEKCRLEDVIITDETVKDYCRKKYVPKEEFALHGEEEYLKTIRMILDKGLDRGDRTGVGTRSIFGARMEYDISNTVPIFTTKRVFWKKVVGELLWFLSGSTSVEDLQKNNIRFWDANSSRDFLDKRGLTEYEEGDLGPVYGFQWRHWGATYQGHKHDYTGEGTDQIAEVLRLLKEDPFSRRILLSAWNVAALPKMALPPCHLLAQFYVREENNTQYLDCQLYQRSGDMFLGVPFNVTCYSVLVYILCEQTGMKPGRFIHIIGDAHIYQNHMEAVNKQLSNTPRPFPSLSIKPVSGIHNYSLDDFSLVAYESCGYIKAPMAV